MKRLIAVFAFSLIALASQEWGASISPSRVEIGLRQGEMQVVDLTLTGNGEFNIGAQGLSMKGDQVVLTGEPCTHLSPSPKTVRVAGQTSFKLSIQAPSKAGTTTCLLTLTPTTATQGAVVGLGIPVYVTLSGTEKIGLGIAVLKNGQVALENAGNTLLRLQGFLSYVEGGKEVAKVPIQDMALLPGNTRIIPSPPGIAEGQVVAYLEGAGRRWSKQGNYSR